MQARRFRKTQIIVLVITLLLAVAVLALWTRDIPRAELERRYLQASGDLVDIDGVRLHVRDSGPRDAPALLLLHGFGASLHTWDAWAAALQDRYRIVRLDLPGSGLSHPDPTGVYTDARSVQLLLALLDRLQLPKATVVGHSIGGRMAWTMAAQHPQRVDKLVLLAPDGFASPGFEYGRAHDTPVTLELMRFTLPRWLLRMSLEPAYADPSVIDGTLIERYHALMLAPGTRAAMIARLAQTVLVDPVPVLRTIQAPTLLLWGEQDQAIPIANAADYERALPNVKVVRLPATGHLPQEERPERALQPLLAFLALPPLLSQRPAP